MSSPDSRKICSGSAFEEAVINKKVIYLFLKVVGLFLEIGCPVMLVIMRAEATMFLLLVAVFSSYFSF